VKFELEFPITEIPGLASQYSYPGGDDSVMLVGEAARSRGYFTYDEFLDVCRWKTARSKSRVARNSEGAVEEATRLALTVKSDALRIGIPMCLEGVSWATSSVLLHFAHPEPYPIIDYRALEAFGVRKTVVYTLPFWLAYVEICRRTASTAGVDMRTLDRALWQWSKGRVK
jgi:hypothetical protein